MRYVAVFAALAMMASCGADGEPVTPTGQASVTMSTNGVSARTQVGVQQGPVSLTLGLGL